MVVLFWWAGQLLLTGAELALTSTNNRVITRVQDVLNLSAEEAAQNVAVKLKGEILLYDSVWDLCFLQDKTAAIYLWRMKSEMGLVGGEEVEVSGFTSSGNYSPIVQVTNLVLLARTPLESAPRTGRWSDLESGQLDSQWIELVGVVHSEGKVAADREWLELGSRERRLRVNLLKPWPGEGKYPSLRDARVRVRGVAVAEGNARRQLTGYGLMVPSPTNVTVLEPPPVDPFASARLCLGRSLLSYSQRDSWDHQVRVQGVVLLHIPGEVIYVRDASGGFRIRTTQTEVLAPGQRIEALGFASRGMPSPEITDPLIRLRVMGPAPTPMPVNYVQIADQFLDAELVQLEAELVNYEASRDGYPALHLTDGTNQFKAMLLTRRPPEAPPPWKLGSLVQLTGISVMAEGSMPEKTNYVLWVESPANVHLMRLPAQRLGIRFLWTLGLALSAVLVIFGWTLLLRHQVRQQTAVIRGREEALEVRYRDLFENAHDIIFTHDMSGAIQSLNRAGVIALGFDGHRPRNMNLMDFLPPPDRERYRQLVKRHQTGQERSRCELEVCANGGRQATWAVDIRLDYQEGQPVGIRGIARDISERKQAEEALRRSEQELRRSLQERQRIARDLHDGIIQSIYAIGLGLEDCRQRIMQDARQAEQRLKNCLQELNRVIREVRSFIGDMDVDRSAEPGFMAQLQNLLDALGENTRARVEMHVDPEVVSRLAPHQVPQLLHIARESLSNSLRHSEATRIELSLRAVQDRIRLEIKDNGKGFDVALAERQGNGLRNTSARAGQMGARLVIESRPGCGASVVIDLPPEKVEKPPYASN